MLKTFSLETGENDEGRFSEHPPYTDQQLAEFHRIIQEGNALDMATFSQVVGPDAMRALNGTFEKGQVASGKKRCKELETEGWQILHSYVDQIREHLGNDDPAALELTGEMTPIEKRIVANMLTDLEVAKLGKMKEQAA